MSERNWEKDWELCQKASPSPWRVVGKDSWKLKGFPQVEINTPEGHYFPVNFECDAIFIAEARDALPYWLQRVRELEAQVAVMREVLELCIPKDNEIFINAPEDSAVRLLCDMYGYGAMMTSVARQWRKKDPIGAFTIGPCLLTVQKVLKEAE